MNPSSLLGILTSLVFLVLVVLFGADKPTQFFDWVGLLIVIGGTMAATFLSFPFSEVMRVFRLVGSAVGNERLHAERHIAELVNLSRLWIKGDLRAVEEALEGVTNPFLKTGVQLVIDSTPQEYISDLLNWRITRMRQQEAAQAQLFRVMAAYAPAFGMVGTLLGLVNLMDLLGVGDVSGIGKQLGVALLTTFYGILLANLVFKPLAVRLERRTERRLIVMNMVLEGIAMMSARHSPSLMEETLKSFVARIDDDLSDGRRPRRVAKREDAEAKKA